MVKFVLVLGLILPLAAAGETAALTTRPCDPVWEIPRPAYKRIRGRWVRAGWYCEVRQPNGGPSTGGGSGSP